MANFLDDLSIYNAKAAAAISAAVVECNNEKANMMSSLKTTANDITLSEEIRLNALTALINLGNLLDIPLPPYFPSVTTYALTETFVGVHNDLDGLQGGAPGEYYHLTAAEKTAILNKASVGDITWAQLGGVYSDNALFGPLFDAKQDGLVAPTSATYFLKVSGNVVSYDNNVYLSSIEGITAGGELEGTYRNPNLSNAAVIGKVLTGFDPFASIGTITASDTILSAIEKLNANIDSVIANPSGVASVAFTNNAASVFTTTASPSTGAASLSLSLNTQTANLVLASPNATTGQPSFRALVAADLPNSGVTAATYGSSTVIPQIQVDAKGRITSVTAITAASGGQVNTITLAVPSFLGLSSINNTLPASPQIVLQLATQTANTVFAGPQTGAAAAPTFRLLVEDDIPQLSTSKITNLTNILNNFLTNNLSDGSIWIGNTSNAAVPRVLSVDVTVSNLGVTAIGLAKVQYNMIQNVTSQTLLGNYELTDGPVQQITLSALDFVLDDVTGVLSLQNPVAPVVTTKGDLLGHDLTSQQRVPSNNVDGSILLVNNSATGAYTDLGLNWVAMSGDATIIASGAITIANNAVTVGKIQQLPAFTVIGNATSGLATPTALSKTDLTTLVNQFTASASGAVPATGAAAGDSTKFLNAAGGWTTASGGGGTTTNALTIGSGLSGTAATFNGSAAVTISLNTGNANTWTALQTFTSASGIYLGEAGTSSGNLRFRGTTSGFVQFTSPAAPTNQSYILPTATGTTGQFLKLSDAGTGQLAWDTAGSGSGTVNNSAQYSIPYYSTAGDTNVLSGLAPQTTNGIYFLRANVTGGVAVAPNWDGSTGTGVVVLANTPTLITPVLGVASATSINKVAITAPATSATLTIADGKTFTSSNTLTLTGTDTASIAFGTGGIVAYVGVSNSWTAGVKQTFAPNATNAGMNVGSLAGDPSAGVNGDIVYNTTSNALRAYINGAWVSLGSGGGGGVTTFQTSLSGLSPSTATAGAITLSGTLGVGSGGTGATTLTGLLRGTGTTAIAGSAVVGLTSEVTGTLPIGNGGTGLSTNTAYAVVLGGTTNGGVLTQVLGLGSSGQVLTSTGPSSPPTWQTGGGSVVLNNIVASTGSNTPINNATSTIQWNWNSNTTTNAFVLNSTFITSGALLAVTHSNSAFTGTSGIVSFTSSAVTTGTILSVAHTGSSLTGNVTSFTSTTLTSGTVLNLGISGSTATSAKNLVITNSSTANTSGRGIDVLISGSTASATTYGAFISNTKNGTAAYSLYLNASGAATTNYGIAISATGGTTNYAIDVVAGISRFAAGTATVPQIVLSPSSLNGALTGITNGSIWYDTTTASSNSSLYLYKDSLLTKFITLDRNPDFSGGATSGIVVSDSNGTLSKSADLTALGIFSVYANTGNITTNATETTMIGTSLVGSTTLPANFFAVGKTLRIFASGTIDNANNDTTTIRFKLGATTIGTFSITGMHDTTTNGFVMEAYIICNASGASGTVRIGATFFAEGATPSGEHTWYLPLATQAGTINTTTSLAMDVTNQWGQPSCTMVVNFMTCYYIN